MAYLLLFPQCGASDDANRPRVDGLIETPIEIRLHHFSEYEEVRNRSNSW
jgi:hypothetical protein